MISILSGALGSAAMTYEVIATFRPIWDAGMRAIPRPPRYRGPRMTKPKILVTAAAGKTGAATALLLLERGYPVRALVRRDDARAERLRQAGAEVLAGSLEDICDLRRAVNGVDRAYFCAE
jgi:NADPH:quinone reductase-like Zn-dependent oxidoreductase